MCVLGGRDGASLCEALHPLVMFALGEEKRRPEACWICTYMCVCSQRIAFTTPVCVIVPSVAAPLRLTYCRKKGDMEVRVARIFNTFGPRMHPNDGRVVSNFIIQAIQGKDITIYGEEAEWEGGSRLPLGAVCSGGEERSSAFCRPEVV